MLWSKLITSNDFEFHFFYGKNNKLNIKEIDFNKKEFRNQKIKLHHVKNLWVSNNILVWQKGVIRKCFKDKFDVAIFLGEFQVLSTWLAMIICKIRGIKVVYWSHGLYGNESLLKKYLRLFFYNTANKLLLYENRAAKLLIDEGIDKFKIDIIYNSLNYDAHLNLRNSIEKSSINKFKNELTFKNIDLPYLVFVGRLTKIKKLDLLIKALSAINKDEIILNLLLIGEGGIKEELINLVDELSQRDYVQFYGSCYNEEKLANFVYFSELCVSPGNVGLTAIHSMSFGTPVCTHNNFSNQMPEVEAIKEGSTGIFFEENDLYSLSKSIESWMLQSKYRQDIRKECYKIIDEKYNPYYQIGVLKKILKFG